MRRACELRSAGGCRRRRPRNGGGSSSSSRNTPSMSSRKPCWNFRNSRSRGRPAGRARAAWSGPNTTRATTRTTSDLERADLRHRAPYAPFPADDGSRDGSERRLGARARTPRSRVVREAAMMRASVRPITFAHRGARTEAPENTLPAFRRALELGAGGLETDAWVSRRRRGRARPRPRRPPGSPASQRDEVVRRRARRTGRAPARRPLRRARLGVRAVDRRQGPRRRRTDRRRSPAPPATEPRAGCGCAMPVSEFLAGLRRAHAGREARALAPPPADRSAARAPRRRLADVRASTR